MKNARNLIGLFLGVGLFWASLPFAHAEEMAIVTLRPQELLRCLPPAESGWRLTASNAQDIPDPWPRTKALREYVFEDPAAGGTLAKLQITVLDTGGHPGTLQRFSAAGEPGAASKVIRVAGMPALRKDEGDGKQRIEALAQNRFLIIITLETSGQAPEPGTGPKPDFKADNWTEKVNLAMLESATKTAKQLDVSKNHKVIVERIDEINPKRSSRTTWSFPIEAPPES